MSDYIPDLPNGELEIFTQGWLSYWLVEQGADINLTDSKGDNLLTYIARQLGSSTSKKHSDYWKSSFKILLECGGQAHVGMPEVINAINVVFETYPPLIDLLLHLKTEEDIIENLRTNPVLDQAELGLLLKIAVAQGAYSLAHHLLDAAGDLISESVIEQLLHLSAQRGDIDTFTMVMSHVDLNNLSTQRTLRQALLVASAQGKTAIVNYLTSPQDNNDVQESPLKKRKTDSSTASKEQATNIISSYDPSVIISQEVIYHALTRAARQGHNMVVQLLLSFIKRQLLHTAEAEQLEEHSSSKEEQRTVDEKVDSKNVFINAITKSVEARYHAAAPRNNQNFA